MKILMSILLLAFALAISAPAFAANENATPTVEEADKPDGAPKTADTKTDKDNAPAGEDEKKSETPKPGEYSCKYYSVKLPDNWRAVVPPTDQEGTVNAIFAKSTGKAVVTMIIGPNGGADAKTIAEMFAEQFKAPKPPTEKNGQFVFSFPQDGDNSQAFVSVSGPEFMVTTIAGNQKEALNFIRDNIKSDDYANLLPQ